jgi:hypothetical protein
MLSIEQRRMLSNPTFVEGLKLCSENSLATQEVKRSLHLEQPEITLMCSGSKVTTFTKDSQKETVKNAN